MEPKDWRRPLNHVGLQLCLLRFKGGQPVPESGAVAAVLDGRHQSPDFTIHSGEAPGTLLSSLLPFCRSPVRLLLESIDELAYELRRHQARLQTLQDAALEFAPADRRRIAARALGTAGGAAIAVEANQRVSAAADAAFEQARKKGFWAMRAVQAVATPGHIVPASLLPRTDRVPEIVFDDPKLRHLHHLPARLRIWTGDTLACPRVLHIGAAVPFQPPDIDGVVQNAGAPLCLAADRRVAPFAPAGARNPGRVQCAGNRPRRLARSEVAKYPFNNDRLVTPDAPLAGLAVDERIAVCVATRDLAGKRAAELPSLGLVAQVREIKLGHRAHQADMERRHLAKLHRMQRDVEELQPVVQLGDVGELAADPVESFADDDLKTPLAGIGDHLLVARPVF